MSTAPAAPAVRARSSGIALALGVLGLLALVGYALTAPGHGGTTMPVTVTAQPPITLPGGTWQAVALPVPADQLRTYAVAPGDPATIVACSAAGTGPISAWETHDTGAHWIQLALPTAPGASGCDIAFAPDQPKRVAMLLEYGAAATPTLALSDDGGATWRASAHGAPVPGGTITIWSQVLVSAHAIYIATSYANGSGANGTDVPSGNQVTQLVRSDDDGASWATAAGPFGANALYMAWQLGDGNSLLASVLSKWPPLPDRGPDLWITHDGGRHWANTATLPPGVGTFILAPSRPGAAIEPTRGTPLYALSGEQIPSELFRLRVLQSDDGQHWAWLPPLPVPGTSPTRTGYLQALGVAPDGRLLVLGPTTSVPSPGAQSSPATPSAAVWLWLWDPRTSRWNVLAPPLETAGSTGCGALCWHGQIAAGPAGASYLYLAAGEHQGAVTPSLFRVRLPANSAR